ncbi:hypothetical protein INT47_006598 [Mucor saturninus]|uniref:P-loop containing nucleoside triphosphate hydrolase protein n=1 Tax=Mucor saturninus TaxID=64648 RepID=A0A8H7QM11_9FUNG|nr:hypothetical protein INT47_006598 [Mucor saturninus]
MNRIHGKIANQVPVFEKISIAISLCVLLAKAVKHHKQDHSYTLINQKAQLPSYGTVDITSDSSSSDTAVTPPSVEFEKRCQPWSVYNLMRLILSVSQLALVVYGTWSLIHDASQEIDKEVEGSYSNMLRMYYARIGFWTFGVLLAVLNIVFSLSADGTTRAFSDVICKHLNVLYILEFLIQLVNLNAYYQVYDISTVSDRYQACMVSFALTILLLLFAVNEERYAPAEPIIADTGRIMSGENWASTYSKFMFSWVNEMMEKGNNKTLNDEDLIELPTDNRAKFTLMMYRLQRKSTMVWNLLSCFKIPLWVQFWYSLGWSVLMFGPPFFLNKIIKFIENGHETDEPVSSAFIYVLCLFLTSSGQSLSYQQALYIGRTLGIRIQSIVIGEVYEKSLRRRDESGGTAEEGLTSKPKINVNNLLSVDAQKMGDLTAYVFYIYCFPIQITICIWSLYKLLGNASLWGVFIICISQPLIYWLSRRIEKIQHRAMACTDKRIRLMDELLSAIRIIKFFAWEKQFRERVNNSRKEELKAVRSRLYSMMVLNNIWFLIPVMIMVAVFYAYTREFMLTASTAFTALALFNNFKSTLDELPFITSFILQANVSLSRIEKFLQEEEIQPLTPNTASSTHVGFIDNASFSWNKGSDATAHVKNLNISFPLNKLSIVCGPTGSGKTTLLSSLLGETYCLSGSAILPRKQYTKSSLLGGAVSGIAYVAQTAWLQNCSIRDNILFGLDYDQERYEKILYMTALTRDLEILEFGDSTEVGEKGITLSGGQKQRVAIARAVYSQADIVILDDCLSAVDAHTAKHLHEFCLMGEYMRDRTVILVTHHVGLCLKSASYVVALEESGSVAAVGTPLQVIQSGVLGEDFSEESWMQEIDAEEEAALEGPIPNIPKKNDKVTASGADKLVQEEKRAEGGVSWGVYKTYYHASGGFFLWLFVLSFYFLAQASVMGQDYWIKVWSSAYTSLKQVVFNYSEFSAMSTPNEHIANAMHSYNFMIPASVKAFATVMKEGKAVDVGYYLGIYFLIGMLSLCLTTIRYMVLFAGSLEASKRIHAQLLDRILRAKVRFFDTTPMGRIVNRFSSDLETIDQAVAPSLSFLVYSIVATLYVTVLVSVITPAFIIPGVFVAYMFKSMGLYYLNSSRDLKRLNSVSRSPIYVQFNETVIGVATIRAFGCQRRFIEESFSRVDANNRPFIWMWATNRWLHCRVEVMGAFVSFCAGTVLVMSREWVNPGLAGLSLSYALTFTHHVLWVVRMYAANEMNMNAIERVHEYLDVEEEPPTHIPETAPRASWPESGTVQVKNLVMKYAADSPAVLRDVSFETRPREKIGIVGRTGSGKSTLAMSLFRFMEPTDGSILIDGVDIHKIGLDDLRSKLTIIPQDPVLFSGTLRSNLDPFGQYEDAELWAALKRSHLIDSQLENDDGSIKSSNVSSVENISLDSPVTANGNNWSQGQRQLIALARALVKSTSLIILDEATSSVDFDTDHQIQQTIREEFNESTLLCIAHRIRTVADYDRILVLDHGEVKEFDSPYELMTRDGSIFQQMCERSGEFPELLAIAKAKFDSKVVLE